MADKILSPNPQLLDPGYAGLITHEEAEYIKQHLKKSGHLRRRWGIEGNITLTKIAALAFPENPKLAINHIRSQK